MFLPGNIGCHPEPGTHEVLEGAEVVLTCEVWYTGYKAPYLTWEDQDGDMVGEYIRNWEKAT